jgi:peptide/nickel transport system permease protein
MRVGYLIRRLLFLLGVIWTSASLNFILPHLTGRDPITERITLQIATQGLSPDGAEEMIASYKKLFGLDQPLWQQYVRYLWNMLRFDLGYSITAYPKPVMEIIQERAGYTIGMVGIATVLAFVLGTLIGALLGWNKSPKVLNVLIPPLMIFSAAPPFVLALILIYFLSFRAQLFPLRGAWKMTTTPNWADPSFWTEVLHHATLPALSLLLVSAGAWALGMRAMMVTVEGDDYMTFAEAKGLKGVRIFFLYALRNALLPQITGLAVRLGAIVAGSTLVEVYFAYPGLGTALNGAIGSFDYYVIYGIVFFLVTGIALATFVVDMIYPLLDPRISYQRGT